MNYRLTKTIELEIADLKALILAKESAAAAQPDDHALKFSIGQYRHRLKLLNTELAESRNRE